MDRQFSSFRAKIDTDVLNQINQVDSKVKNEILNESTAAENSIKHEAWSPEPIFTFGKAKSPMFNIRASPIPSPDPIKLKSNR